ncbi:MAG: LysR family transcriptional regulator [Roseovarius sp.]|nr:LysR family transcriptional regulator [Roseovarius sp.]
MSSRLRLRQLEALDRVAATGSMTRAAEELGISQPAVSRLLSDLSGQVGFALLDRRDGRLVPTQEARFLLPDIHRVLETLDRIGEASRHLNDRKAGHLRLACLPGFANSHLPGVLARFLADRPGVTATVEPDRPERILEWIVGEQFDCGITDGFEGHPAVLSEVVPIRTVCILPPCHPLERKATITPADLTKERMIHTRRDSAFFRALNEAFLSEGVTMTTLIEIRQFTAACELVLRGAGVSVISALDAAGYEARGLIHRPFVPEVVHRLALVRPVHGAPSLLTLEFMDAFRDSLRPFEAG